MRKHNRHCQKKWRPTDKRTNFYIF